MEEGRVFVDKAAREALIKCLDWDLLCNVINGPYGQIPGSGVITPACKGLWQSLDLLSGCGRGQPDSG